MAETSPICLVGEPVDLEDLNALADWIRTNPRITMADLTRQFEEEFATWLGRKHVVLVNSGSQALLLAYAVLTEPRERPWTDVLFPALCWPTTISGAIQLGYRPRPCEIETRSWGISPDHLDEAYAERRPRIVTVVHVLGHPCNMAAVEAAKQKHQFTILEDSCAALGAVSGDKRVGTLGDLSCFSFHANHALSCLEGGAVATDAQFLADRLRLLRAHGWTRDLSDARRRAYDAWAPDKFRSQFTFHAFGTNSRPTEIAAFLLLRGLKKLDGRLRKRTVNDRQYRKRLTGKFKIQIGHDCALAQAQPTIAFGFLADGVDHRLEIVKRLREANIECRPIGTGNIARQPMWRNLPRPSMPNADAVWDSGIQVPNGPHLAEEDVDRVCNVIEGVG